MDAQFNPFRMSFENSKDRRLHLLRTGHLTDCEFLVGVSNEDANNVEENADDNLDTNENSVVTNGNDKQNDVKVTPNPAEQNDSGVDVNNTIIRNMENCEITGPKLFQCHKMALAITSEVFERMFYGGFDEQPSPIRVLDIRPAIFEIFINYIYTYDLDPNNVNMRNFGELLYVAEKYMLKEFSNLCVEIIKEKTWLLTDVLPMFELACLYDNNELFLLCQEKICADAVQLLKDHTFYDLNINYLSRLMILLTEHSNVKLMQLLTALERYGKTNKLCEERNAESFVKLVNAACNLNYGEMDAQEYASGPGISYLFANKYDEVLML